VPLPGHAHPSQQDGEKDAHHALEADHDVHDFTTFVGDWVTSLLNARLWRRPLAVRNKIPAVPECKEIDPELHKAAEAHSSSGDVGLLESSLQRLAQRRVDKVQHARLGSERRNGSKASDGFCGHLSRGLVPRLVLFHEALGQLDMEFARESQQGNAAHHGQGQLPTSIKRQANAEEERTPMLHHLGESPTTRLVDEGRIRGETSCELAAGVVRVVMPPELLTQHGPKSHETQTVRQAFAHATHSPLGDECGDSNDASERNKEKGCIARSSEDRVDFWLLEDTRDHREPVCKRRSRGTKRHRGDYTHHTEVCLRPIEREDASER